MSRLPIVDFKRMDRLLRQFIKKENNLTGIHIV